MRCTTASMYSRNSTSERNIAAGEIDELSTQTLECLSDLGLWSYQLKLDSARVVFEDLALDVANWIITHGGYITLLEPVVNALTRQANAASDVDTLGKVYDRACSIIAYVAPDLGETTDSAALQPWLTLHINCAIIATRSQQPERMTAAYDMLETNLPQHFATFHEAGVRESRKTVCEDYVRETMRERLAKWTGCP